MYPTKQIAVAEMRVMLEQTKALWFQAISEAGPDPSKESMLRALADCNNFYASCERALDPSLIGVPIAAAIYGIMKYMRGPDAEPSS
jgi:hypothetical protein